LTLNAINLGAFGKVRLCKIKKSNFDQAILNRSAPVKSVSNLGVSSASKDAAPSSSAVKGSSQDDEVQICAVKILSKSAIIKAKQVDHVYNEMALQQQLNHPFIVNLRGLQQDARSLYLIMDFVDGGELYKLINNREKLDIDLARFYAA
jgi:serine/threonine protein kinase